MNAWVTCPKPNPQAILRLFCFPYAGSGSGIFRSWLNCLPINVEICPIELPGRGMRLMEPPFTRISPLVEAIALSLLPYLNQPFACFGHSMGALISFELTRLLRDRYDRSPVHLFISGRRAPQIPDLDPPIHALPDPDFIDKLRHLNGTPAAVLENDELMQLLLPTLRADFAVLETYAYVPEPPLECPITTFGGLQDAEVSYKQLEAWRDQTLATFSLQMLPGNHFFIHSAQALLLEALAQALSQ